MDHHRNSFTNSILSGKISSHNDNIILNKSSSLRVQNDNNLAQADKSIFLPPKRRTKKLMTDINVTKNKKSIYGSEKLLYLQKPKDHRMSNNANESCNKKIIQNQTIVTEKHNEVNNDMLNDFSVYGGGNSVYEIKTNEYLIDLNKEDFVEGIDSSDIEIITLLNAMILCQTGKIISADGKIEYITDFPEEQAALSLCEELDHRIISQTQNLSNNGSLCSMVIKDRDGGLNTYEICSQNVSMKKDGHLVVSVLVSNSYEIGTSTLYVRGLVECMKPLLSKKEQRNNKLNFSISYKKNDPGYRYIYAKRELSEVETSKAKSDLRN